MHIHNILCNLNKLTQFKFKYMLDYQNKNFYLSFLKFNNK